MPAMAPPSEYEDDAARIDREYIPDSATSEDEIADALDAAGFPQASQSHIEDWLVSESDAWDVVDSEVQDAGTVEREIRRQSGGTVSETRARSMADEIADEIQSARSEAAQRVDDRGQIRTEDGRVIGKPSNVEETVRDDGIYFRNTETGTEGRAARFDKGGR